MKNDAQTLNRFQQFFHQKSVIALAIGIIVVLALLPVFVAPPSQAADTKNVIYSAEPGFLKACNGGKLADNDVTACRNLITGFVMGHITTIKVLEIRADQANEIAVTDQLFCPTDTQTNDDIFADVLAWTGQNRQYIRPIFVNGGSNVDTLTVITKALIQMYPCGTTDQQF